MLVVPYSVNAEASSAKSETAITFSGWADEAPAETNNTTPDKTQNNAQGNKTSVTQSTKKSYPLTGTILQYSWMILGLLLLLCVLFIFILKRREETSREK